MAATITKNADGDLSLGNLRAELITVTPAATDYPTGGYPLVAANMGMAKILGVIAFGLTSGFDINWNPATGKIQLLGTQVTTAGATIYPQVEIAANTNVAAFQLLVIGL